VPTPLLVLLSALLATYAAQMLLAAVGFARVRTQPAPDAPRPWPAVSIVVPARNEAGGIDACLDSLRAVDYPPDRLEIIVVDDFSTDGTAEQVRARQPAGRVDPADQPVRLVEMASSGPANGGHKPAAVARGVEAAEGDVILTTDADCVVPPAWVKSMVRRCTPETPFVAGPVGYVHNDRFLPRLQALELTGLVAYGAGTIGVGLPTFCNSANVAYRRDAVQARAAAPDGAARDEMLLQYVAYDTDRRVTFNPDPDATVRTEPPGTLTGYLQQQARWAHMGLRYPFALPRALVVGLWGAHAALFLACAAALALPAWREPALLLLLGKMAADAVLAVPAARHFGVRGLLRSAVPTELLLLVAVPFIGVLGTVGAVEWKGRPLD
jgi:cellulose synthase/poly-beta-1,6-N-acetylglucosamine synthase-like glycosyltransferase